MSYRLLCFAVIFLLTVTPLARVDGQQGRVAISRTIDGLRLGSTTSEIQAIVRAGWGKDYFDASSTSSTLLVPTWMQLAGWMRGTQAGELTKLPSGTVISTGAFYELQKVDIGHQAMFFRTEATKHTLLYFYQDKLYQISMEPNGNLLNAIQSKYGPGKAMAYDTTVWQDSATTLIWSSSSGLISYRDRAAWEAAKIAAAAAERQADTERNRQQQKVPKGF